MGFRTIYSSNRFNTPVKGEAVVKIDGIDLQQYGFILSSYPDLVFPGKRNRYYEVNHKAGSRDYGGSYDNWTFQLEGIIAGISHADMLLRLDEFKSAFDFTRFEQYEYILNAIPIQGHFFEISGHKHWYTTGTVTGTATTITGTNTQWTKYTKPGAEIEFNGHTTKYYVLNVISDTEIEITPTLTASLSGASYRVERKRYLIVNLDGESAFAAFSSAGFLSQTKLGSTHHTKGSNFYNTSIELTTAIPYWIGDPFIHSETSLASGSFIDILGIGNAITDPIIRVVGAVNNPKITACEVGFHSHYNNTLKGKALRDNVDGTYGVTGTLVAGKVGQAVNFTGGATFIFDAMSDASAPTGPATSKFNRYQGAVGGWFRFGFANTDTNTRILFTDNAASATFVLRWNGSLSRIEATDGTNTVFRNPGAFSADTWFHIIVQFSHIIDVDTVTVGTQLFQIWVDNVLGTGSATYATGTPGTTLSFGSDNLSANKYVGLLDELAIWDEILEAADITTLYNSGTGRASPTVKFTPLVYFPIDGATNITDDEIGSSRDLTIKTSATTTTTVTVAAGGAQFVDNDAILVYDEIGYNVGGFINGTPTATSITLDDGSGANIANLSELGVCAGLNGTNQYFQAGNILDITTGHVAISAWIKTSSSAQQCILAKSDSTTTVGYMLYLDTAGKLNSVIHNGAASSTMISTKTVNDGNWHFVAVTWTRSVSIGNELIIDGIRDQVSTPTSIGASLTNTLNFTVGAESDGGFPFNGRIRDVKFWGSGANTFLSSGPVPRRDMMDVFLAPLTAVTMGGRAEDGFWKFSDATAGALGTDSSGNGNTLTPQNSPTRIQEACKISTNLTADPDMENSTIGGGWEAIGNWDPLPPGNGLSKVTSGSQFKDLRSASSASDTTGEGIGKLAKVPKGSTILFGFRYTASTSSLNWTITDTTTGTAYTASGMLVTTTYRRHEQVITIDNTGANTHILRIGFTTLNDTYNTDDWRFLASSLPEGECEATTNWGQVGTLTTFDVNSTNEHNGINAIRFEGNVNGEGVFHTLNLSAQTWYESHAFTKVDVTDTPGNQTLSLNNFSDIVGQSSSAYSEDNLSTSIDGNGHDRHAVITLIKSDTSGQFQLVADTNELSYIDDAAVIKRHNIVVTGIAAALYPTYIPACNGIAIKIPNERWIDYTNLITGNRLQMGFFMRFAANFASTDGSDHFMFVWNDDATGANAFKLFYRSSDDKWVLRIRSAAANVDTFASDTAQVFSSGNMIELSGWYHSLGRLDDKDNTTYYGKMFLNGIEMAKITSTITAPAVNLNRLRISAEAPTEGSYGLITLDEMALFVHAPTDEELMGYHTYNTMIQNKNMTLEATVNLAANDILSVNTTSMKAEKFEASTGIQSIIQAIGSIGFKGHDNTESQILYITADGTIPKIIFQFRPSWR